MDVNLNVGLGVSSEKSSRWFNKAACDRRGGLTAKQLNHSLTTCQSQVVSYVCEYVVKMTNRREQISNPVFEVT